MYHCLATKCSCLIMVEGWGGGGMPGSSPEVALYLQDNPSCPIFSHFLIQFLLCIGIQSITVQAYKEILSSLSSVSIEKWVIFFPMPHPYTIMDIPFLVGPQVLRTVGWQVITSKGSMRESLLQETWPNRPLPYLSLVLHLSLAWRMSVSATLSHPV